MVRGRMIWCLRDVDSEDDGPLPVHHSGLGSASQVPIPDPSVIIALYLVGDFEQMK